MWEEICLSVKPVAKAEMSFSLSLLFTCFIAFLFRRFFARVSDFSFLLPISRGNLSPWSSYSWVCNTLLRQQRTAANKDHPSALQNVFSWLLGREHTDHHCSSAFYCKILLHVSHLFQAIVKPRLTHNYVECGNSDTQLFPHFENTF